MTEPANLTALANAAGVWVRVDSPTSAPWHLLAGDGFDVVGSSHWLEVEPLGPFVRADAALTEMAVGRVRAHLAGTP